MSSMTCPDRRARPKSSRGAAIFTARSLVVAVLVTLAGCATPDRAPVLAPPVYITQSTWWQIDSDIGAASRAAAAPAGNYARGSMESWRQRVEQRTEANFIPWFTGYWTQQWLAVKVAWYKLSGGEGTDPAVQRLAAYLQEQYRDRVLAPVAREIDPDAVREQATTLYVRLLGEQLEDIARRYGVPADQFAGRLRDIPAIALAPPPAHSASLYQLVHADPLAGLPAYAALSTRSGTGAGLSESRVSPVAKRASERLVARLATSGGAGAAAAAVGGVAGMIISLGAAGYGAIAHENERPEMEAQLRETLNAAVHDMWLGLTEDPVSGVMTGVHYLSTQIEGSLARPLAQPVQSEPAPREIPLPDEPLLEDDESDGGALPDDWETEE